MRTTVAVGRDERTLVDIRAEVSGALLEKIEDLGGSVVNHFVRFDAIRAFVPLTALEQLAAEPAVHFIRSEEKMMVHKNDTTEGDIAHRANTARTTFGVDGTGVSVGAMSDSVDSLADLQASGNLPAGVTVLTGQSGNPGTSEGTALLEIIFDMAPGADLFFATGNGGQAQFAQNILDLQAAGCDVIVDDVGYFAEPVFQDGVIAQAVETVADAGVLFFSAAGNSGNINDGTSGVWEGDYAGIALPPVLVGSGVSAHDFGGGTNFNTITQDSPFLFTLQWADPQDGSSNDYDLFLLDAGLTTVLDSSTNAQSGTQDPLEFIDTTTTDDTGANLVVVLSNGSGRYIHLNSHRGRLATGTDGQIFGHPAAESAFAVAAVSVFTAGGGGFTGGPSNPVETFSSDGPRRIFFGADGTPVTTLKGGPESIVRQKPDVAAADGVSTATPGFSTFFGTSASAPHAAAIAALLKELSPGVNTMSARNIFDSTALDIEAIGFDRDSGAGILDANSALDNTVIFSDGFESGNTSVWSSTVP